MIFIFRWRTLESVSRFPCLWNMYCIHFLLLLSRDSPCFHGNETFSAKIALIQTGPQYFQWELATVFKVLGTILQWAPARFLVCRNWGENYWRNKWAVQPNKMPQGGSHMNSLWGIMTEEFKQESPYLPFYFPDDLLCLDVPYFCLPAAVQLPFLWSADTGDILRYQWLANLIDGVEGCMDC